MQDKTVILSGEELEFLTDAILHIRKVNLCRDIMLTDKQQKMVVNLIKKLNG